MEAKEKESAMINFFCISFNSKSSEAPVKDYGENPG